MQPQTYEMFIPKDGISTGYTVIPYETALDMHKKKIGEQLHDGTIVVDVREEENGAWVKIDTTHQLATEDVTRSKYLIEFLDLMKERGGLTEEEHADLSSKVTPYASVEYVMRYLGVFAMKNR